MFTYISTTNRKYKLCAAKVIIRGGKETKVYYFIENDLYPKHRAKYADKLPDGFEVRENPRTKKPLVVKSRN